MRRAKTPKVRTMAGIDVSAKTLQVAFRGLNGVVRDLEFPNDPTVHKRLCALFGRARPARVCLEATSLHGLDVAIALHAAGGEVMVANPKAARRFIEAQMTRAKTDKVDAHGLLAFLERMEFVAWYPPSDARLTLRMLSRRIHDLVTTATAEQNRLHAVRATKTTPPFVVADLEVSLRQIDERVAAMVAHAVAHIQATPELARAHAAITTIRGIKDRSAVAILGELLLLPADLTPREVVAHAGLDPRPRDSGTSIRGRNAISKVGNARLRAALFLPAMCASRFEPAMKAQYERLLAAGKKPYVAIVAVMRKMLHALWRMVHTGERFDAARYAPARKSLAAG